MIFIGDVHGHIKGLEWILDHDPSTAGKLCFQVGDMGLGFKGVDLRTYPLGRFKFIRGNHDSPATCRGHANYAGDYGYILGHKLFYLGGAWSIDQKWRTEGVSWWQDEELSTVELNSALSLYLDVRPKYVVTHEAPTWAAYRILTYLTGSKNVEFENTRTSQVLQQMFENHKPVEWIFGHYHVDTSFDIGGCKFTCLNELSKYEVNTYENEN